MTIYTKTMKQSFPIIFHFIEKQHMQGLEFT